MLKIGWSRRDVSTKAPVDIPGQHRMRVSKGILDPVMLHCLVIDDTGDMVIFLSGDFVNPITVLDEIREKTAARRADIPVEKIVYNVTHTHASPCYQREDKRFSAPHDGIEIAPPTEYRAFFTDSAADAVIEAFDARKEGAVSYGYGYAVVGHHRRVVYRDDFGKRPGAAQAKYKSLWVNGHAYMYGNTNDDMFDGYEGVVDHLVNILFTFDADGTLTGAIINVPCPSQNMENEEMLSADFWHDVRRTLREKYGDIGILAQCGAAGDMAPRMLHYKAAEARRYAMKYADRKLPDGLLHPREMYKRIEIAERICAAFDEVFSWAQKDKITEAPVQHTVKTVNLEARIITDEEYALVREDLEKLKAEPFVSTGDMRADFVENTTKIGGIIRHESVIRRYERQKTDRTEKMELHTIRIGDVAFATNPFELFIDYQHRIQARSPFVQTFVVQLCGQPDDYATGYLCTFRAEKNLGYSATMYCNEVSPKGGDTLVEETVKALKELHAKF